MTLERIAMNKESADICKEIREIGRLISSAALIMAVRKEVIKVMKEGFVVTDGKHHPSASKYEVVVRCGESGDEITRRLKSSNLSVEVDKIAEGVLGVKMARRSEKVL
jgi:hypothetical protein